MHGVKNGTRVLERAAFATIGGASTNPAGVEQPCVCLVVRHFLGEHLCVAHGVQCQEGLREARREGGLGLSDAVLGTGHLGGVARDEVEHGLLRGKLGDGRKNAARVASEQDDVRRVAVADARNLSVFDKFNGVGTVITVS